MDKKTRLTLVSSQDSSSQHHHARKGAHIELKPDEATAVSRREMSLIISSLYGMYAQKVGWRDYMITFEKDTIYFDFKKHAGDSLPHMSVIKKKRPGGGAPLYQVSEPAGIIDQSEDLMKLIERAKKRLDKKYDSMPTD